MDKINFTAKEQVLAPHHHAVVISLTVANCMIKWIMVDNGSSIDIIFQTTCNDLGLEKDALTQKFTPIIGYSG